jgi:hypothetical protein
MNDQPWIEAKRDSACPYSCGQTQCGHWEWVGVAARWRADQDPTRNPGQNGGQ